MTDRVLTADEIELIRDALGVAARHAEAAGNRMVPPGVHHLERAETMRQLCARLHNHLCLLFDDDIILIDARALSLSERDALISLQQRSAA